MINLLVCLILFLVCGFIHEQLNSTAKRQIGQPPFGADRFVFLLRVILQLAQFFVFWFYTISTPPMGGEAYPGVDFRSKEDLKKPDIWRIIGPYGGSEVRNSHIPYSDT